MEKPLQEESPLTSLQYFLQKQVNYLNQFQTQIKKLGLYNYPLDAYTKQWVCLTSKITKRKEYCQLKSSPFLLSDLVNWVMPSLYCAYHQIYCFVGKQTASENNIQRFKLVASVSQDLKIEEKFDLKDPSQIDVMKTPLFMLSQLIEKLNTYRQKICLGKENETQQKINLLKNDHKTLQTSVNLMNKMLQFLNTNDDRLNKDSSVLTFNIVSQQYKQIPKNNKYLVKFGCRLKFIAKLKQRVIKTEKRLKDRKLYILQLIDGEKKYIEGLEDYIDYIKRPIQDLNLLSVDEMRTLFSSIEQILKFHETVYKKLKGMFENYNKYQEYGDVLKKFIPFFKLYIDYIFNAQSAQKFLIELSKTHPSIDQICKKYLSEKQKIASNQLLQPTFRIARYEMLMADIIKKTNPDHKDHPSMTEARALFKKNLTEVNDEVDKVMRRNRLNQLDNQFGSKESPIYASKREFLAQFNLLLIRQPKPEPVCLFIFNDIILVVEETTRRQYKRLIINDKFFPRKQEDNKTYRNMITIHSQGYTTFSTGWEQKNANKAEELYQVLRSVTKQSGEMVYVSALGTEQIGSTSFSKHTEYVIEIKYLQLKKLLHLRFSEVVRLVSDMQCHYKDSLKISQEQTLKKNWFYSHKSKTIEDRKRNIAQILQKLMNHQLVKKKPDYLLDYIGLPKNFYLAARTSFEKRMSLSEQSLTVSALKRSYLTKRQQKQAFTILCGTEIKLGRDLYHETEDNMRKSREESKKITIYVHKLDEQQPVKIKITEQDTVEDVCNKVSKLIGLRSNRDFRLFHEIGKKELRVLEHEQKITKQFTFPQEEEIPVLGFFDGIANSLKKIVSPQTYPTLIFKKYYYLPFEIQHAEVRKDLTRLRLIVYQIFSQIREMKYQLTFDEYLLFTALLIYIETEGKIGKIDEMDISIIHRVIPSTVFKLKNYGEEEWIYKCTPHLQRLHEQIQKVILYNKDQMKFNKIKADTASKTALYFGHRHLCSQIVLNKIKANPIFGSNIFYVQPHSSTYEKLQKKDMKVAYNMWLAIKVGSLNLLTPSSKESILELNYKDVQKIEVFSQSIVVKMDDFINEEYRLNTYQSFEISQLVKYNKAMNQILSQIKENKSLNSRIKQYRQELMSYRNTYDEEDDFGGFISMIR